MAESAQLRIADNQTTNKEELIQDSRTASERISETYTPELIIALCGPIGTGIHRVGELLKATIEEKYAYECNIISLSSFIKEYGDNCNDVGTKSAYEYKTLLIDEGNKLREKHGAAILAELAINRIAVDRNSVQNIQPGNEDKAIHEPQRKCYIIDSLKNQAELDILKLVYRDIVYVFGVYSPDNVRNKSMTDSQMSNKEISDLFERDADEHLKHGQMVKQIFNQADFFLRIDSNLDADITSRLIRYLNLMFGHDIVTPTADENAMYLAVSAAGNSACLSRQVGAAITDKNGEIISVGWNDVPKYGGNLYQSVNSDRPGAHDFRCANIEGGKCFNDERKELITNELVKDLIKGGAIEETQKEKVKAVIGKSKIRDIIEFSRAIHAEMHAIIIGSQLAGEKLKNGRLYCTTYPCHNCARHIIVAGIKEVYYIEPYSKSLAITLHSDALTESDEKNKVAIKMFDGVAPSRYLELFKLRTGIRKENGKKKVTPAKNSQPKFTLSLEALPTLESIVVRTLTDRKILKEV